MANYRKWESESIVHRADFAALPSLLLTSLASKSCCKEFSCCSILLETSEAEDQPQKLPTLIVLVVSKKVDEILDL